MNRKNPVLIVVGALLLAIVFLWLFVFQVRKSEVAVVTTFGRPTRPITQPGPYLKWPPPIQRVHTFDQRIQNFESKFEQVSTSDNYTLLIMVYAGWNISDPQVFFPRFGGSIKRAQESLEGLIRNAYSGVVGKHPFSHFISTDEKELKFTEIEKEMLDRIKADASANGYGIDVKFLGIKRLGLPESVTKLVFDRMESERNIRVTDIQSAGEREASEIRTAADLAAAKVLAEADAEATRTRGLADKEAAKSFAVFSQNPELANFLQQLNAMEQLLKEKTTLILDPATPPLNLLRPQTTTNGGK